MKEQIKKIAKVIFIIAMFFIGTKQAFAATVDLQQGVYTSSDGKHVIKINSDNTITFDDTYTLKINKKNLGDTITGKIGSDNKSVTFYQLNNSKIVTGDVITYTHSGKSQTLKDNTVFSMQQEPIVDESGNYELIRNDQKINTYKDLQSAVDAAENNDTIKIKNAYVVESGVYIKGKKITIDGNNNTLTNNQWLNSLFIVETDATLEIKNLTVEGGATGFKADTSKINIQTGTSTSIPLVTNSDKTDHKKTMTLIISKGDLKTDNISINNHYINGNAAALKVLSGTLTIKNSNFVHNRATSKAGAIAIGRKSYADETDFSVKSVLIENSKIDNNYSKNGGGMTILNTKVVDIKNSQLNGNVVTGGKGAAILVENESGGGFASLAERLNLEVPVLNIDKTTFEGNWVGNDGSSIELHDSILNITNSIFKKNVGIHSSSSCGCISISNEVKLKKIYKIDNCVFEENLGSASVIADHGSPNVKFEITNTNFIKNKAVYNSFLMYSGDFLIENCTFDNEHAAHAIIDLRPAVTPNDIKDGYKIPEIIFKNVTFKNTQYNVSDILIRSYNDNEEIYPATVILEGDVQANIDLWNKNKLVINGNHKGTINVAKKNVKENVTINKKATVEKEINYLENLNIITLLIYGLEKKDGYNWEARKYIYSENKTFTEEEFFLEHLIQENDHKLVYYTDKAYTTPWNYEVTGSMTIYGRWETHKHEFDKYTIFEDSIYKQCECGALAEKITIETRMNLTEDSEEKEAIVINEITQNEEDYQVKYLMKNKNGKWVEHEGTPSKSGTYKVQLTYNNMTIEKEYEIAKSKLINPNTSDGIIKSIVMTIVASLGLIIVVIIGKKKYS